MNMIITACIIQVIDDTIVIRVHQSWKLNKKKSLVKKTAWIFFNARHGYPFLNLAGLKFKFLHNFNIPPPLKNVVE